MQQLVEIHQSPSQRKLIFGQGLNDSLPSSKQVQRDHEEDQASCTPWCFKQVRTVWGGLDHGAHRLANESTNTAGMKFYPENQRHFRDGGNRWPRGERRPRNSHCQAPIVGLSSHHYHNSIIACSPLQTKEVMPWLKPKELSQSMKQYHLQLIPTSFSLFSMHPLFILVNVKPESIEDI